MNALIVVPIIFIVIGLLFLIFAKEFGHYLFVVINMKKNNVFFISFSKKIFIDENIALKAIRILGIVNILQGIFFLLLFYLAIHFGFEIVYSDKSISP